MQWSFYNNEVMEILRRYTGTYVYCRDGQPAVAEMCQDQVQCSSDTEKLSNTLALLAEIFEKVATIIKEGYRLFMIISAEYTGCPREPYPLGFLVSKFILCTEYGLKYMANEN